MNSRKLFPLIFILACALLVTASIGKSFALYQNMGSSATVAFEGIFPDLYLRGSFTSPSWAQQNQYKLTDMTNSMTPEEGKVKEFVISGVSLNKDAQLKFADEYGNYYSSSFKDRWHGDNTVTLSGDGNYIVPMTESAYTFYFKLFSNNSTQVYATAEKTKLYLTPNSNWTSDNARFAAYFFKDGGNTWVNMTDADSDGTYEVSIPNGNYTNVIFCRMNPGTNDNNFNEGVKWNQTADLSINQSDLRNRYTVPNGVWDNSDDNNWSTI